MKLELKDILNGYCIFGMYWEMCKRYYDEAGCDNCKYFKIADNKSDNSVHNPSPLE